MTVEFWSIVLIGCLPALVWFLHRAGLLAAAAGRRAAARRPVPTTDQTLFLCIGCGCRHTRENMRWITPFLFHCTVCCRDRDKEFVHAR